MRRLLIVTIFAMIATACTSTIGTTSTTRDDAAPTDTSAGITTASLAPSEQGVSPCLDGDRPFANAGVISAFGGTSGDATQVSGIQWSGHPDCERVEIDLLTVDGAPAGALGPVGVDYDEIVGIVRVNLPNTVTRTAVADSLIDGELVLRAFVVKTARGDMAVDLHVTPDAAVAIRAYEITAPSRIVIDVKPDSEATAVIGAGVAEDVIVLTPPPGPAGSPLVVSGYTRGFEANVLARLHDDPEAAALAEESTVAVEWVEMWGEFAITFEDPPQRTLELFVGAKSALNSDLEGVWITIDTDQSEPPTPPEV